MKTPAQIVKRMRKKRKKVKIMAPSETHAPRQRKVNLEVDWDRQRREAELYLLASDITVMDCGRCVEFWKNGRRLANFWPTTGMLEANGETGLWLSGVNELVEAVVAFGGDRMEECVQ